MFLQPLVLVVSQRIQRQVGRDPEQPRGEFRGRFIRAPRTIYAQKDLLRQFLRQRVVLHHPVEKMNYRRTMFFQKEAKAGAIAFLDAKHKLRIVIQSRHGSRHVCPNPFWHPRLRFCWEILRRSPFPFQRPLHQSLNRLPRRYPKV